MKVKDFPVEFASSLEVAGPTSDGMVHITFVRQAIGNKSEDSTQTDHAGFTAQMATTESIAAPVATIIFPFSRFKSLGLVFGKLVEEMISAQDGAKDRSGDDTAAPSKSKPGDDGVA